MGLGVGVMTAHGTTQARVSWQPIATRREIRDKLMTACSLANYVSVVFTSTRSTFQMGPTIYTQGYSCYEPTRALMTSWLVSSVVAVGRREGVWDGGGVKGVSRVKPPPRYTTSPLKAHRLDFM